jgi:hypothetical protein
MVRPQPSTNENSISPADVKIFAGTPIEAQNTPIRPVIQRSRAA